MTLPRINAETLYNRMTQQTELAVLDVREEGVFAQAHVLAASNVPFSRLERLLPPLVPRLATPIVLIDDDEHLAQRAASVLHDAGYSDVSVLAGGIASWKARGFELFEGVYVPSKAFGEFVEIHYATPHISAHEFQERRDRGEDIVLIDSRPFDEYNWITIPGAIDCPGGELVLRVREIVKTETTLVVVNCGGRTRSIIGAQSLIDAGLPNPVLSLKDGTQGWHLSGLAVERGARRVAPLPADAALRWARTAADRLAERHRVPVITRDTLARFEREQDTTTLYRFDVRDVAEYSAGHRRGFRSAPGGQLVQATDTFIAVRQARIVLADSDGVRARATAAWLVRMGFAHVCVVGDETVGETLETGMPADPILDVRQPVFDEVSVEQLSGLLDGGKAVVVDVATSRLYRAGHIPGAWFAIRGRFTQDAHALPKAPVYVVTSTDSVFARLAAGELRAATNADIKVLAGGTAAWSDAGLALETDQHRFMSEPTDVFLKAFERTDRQEDAMRQYLQWELDLVQQVNRDGTVSFSFEPRES